MRDLPPIVWRAVIVAGAVGVVVLVAALRLGSAGAEAALLIAVAAGGATAGAVARANGAFHGALVGVLWIAAEALLEPFRPAAADVAADLARTVLSDVLLLAAGAAFGLLGARLRG